MGRFIVRTLVMAVVTIIFFVIVFFVIAALLGSTQGLLQLVSIPISFGFFKLPFGIVFWAAFFLFVILLDQIKVR